MNQTKRFLLKLPKVIGFLALFVTIVLLIAASILYLRKDAIWLASKQQMNSSLKGSIGYESISLSFPEHFPNLSLSVVNFSFIDSTSKSQVLHIGKLKADIDLLSVLFFNPTLHTIVVEDASFILFANAKGDLNFSILNQKKEAEKSKDTSPFSLHFDIPLKKIILKNVSFTSINSHLEQSFHARAIKTEIQIRKSNGEYYFKIKGPVFSKGLGFNTRLGYFIKDKQVDVFLEAKIPKDEEKIVLMPSYIEIEKESYHLNGYVVPFTEEVMQLIIHTDNAVVNKVLTCLTPNIESKIRPYQVTNSVHAVITIAGPIVPNQDPKIDLRFWSSNNQFKFMDLPIIVSNIQFEGIVCNYYDKNQVPGDPNTLFELVNVNGRIGYGNLTTHLKIVDIISPKMDAEVALNVDLKTIADSMPDLPFERLRGVVKLNINYKGTIPEGHELSQMAKWKYSGEINFDSIGFMAGGIEYKNINGKLKLKNDEAVFPKGFSFDIANNKVKMAGYLSKPLQHLIFPDTLLEMYLKLQSPYFDINQLMVKSNLKKRKTNKPLQTINKLTENTRFFIDFDIKQALFRKLVVNNLKGQLNKRGQSMALKNIFLETSGGTMQLAVEANQLDETLQSGTAYVKINNMDVKKLFRGMNNFDQKTIEAKHLEGKFSAIVNFSTNFSDDYQIIPKSMQGNFDLQLRNGHLKNFDPIQDISTFLFRRRNFKDIRFEKITQKAVLKGNTLEISDMKVQSNVLTLFIKGKYSFDNEVDLKIRIPWVNFASKDNYSEAVQKDLSDANALHIRAFTKNGKLAFGLGK